MQDLSQAGTQIDNFDKIDLAKAAVETGVKAGHTRMNITECSVDLKWDICDQEKNPYRGEFKQGEKYYVRVALLASLIEENKAQSIQTYEFSFLLFLPGVGATMPRIGARFNCDTSGRHEDYFEFTPNGEASRSTAGIGDLLVSCNQRLFCELRLGFK